MEEKDREELIQKILQADSTKIKSTQQTQQVYVVNQIIEKNPGLLSKKLLVFSQNEDEDHWSVTFVFNPG